ncbi:hypothetical protein CEXT_249601 [Caerostris extrusa]|uniref:Uncharacterized protein n=1 Tax=Caerostris extrusa TaxID=172846 RepID=A0AAV4UHQ9_CAEEX|nr:hypothetical protein CEXT_249601 [Caerostris extrusa]
MQQLATLYPLMELRLSMIMRRLRAKCDGLLLITYHRHFFVPPAKTEMMDIKASRKDQRVGLSPPTKCVVEAGQHDLETRSSSVINCDIGLQKNSSKELPPEVKFIPGSHRKQEEHKVLATTSGTPSHLVCSIMCLGFDEWMFHQRKAQSCHSFAWYLVKCNVPDLN